MRSVLALVALFALLALGAASAPQASGDVSLLQLSSQSQSVASLEAELAAAVQQQQRLEAELGAHADSETEAESESSAEADAVAQLEAQIEAQAAAEVEAQQAAGVASSVDAETETESESTDAASAEAELAAEIDAANAAQAEEAADAAEPAHKALTEVSAEAESEVEGEPVTLSGSVQDNDSGVPTRSPRRPQRPQGERLVHRLVPGPDPERIAKFRARREVVRSERSHPLAAPDRVELPNGKALHKTWIVSPNLRLEKPKPKPTPIHSRERVMTPQQRDRLATYAEHRDAAYMPSEVRRRFLAQNPQVVLDQLRARSYSPESEWLRAMHRGALRRMRFDPPTPPAAVEAPVNGSVAITSNRVSQHVTIRHTPPSIRQRAEMNALRSASRTLRRINAKRREYRRAMRALARARNQVQREMHRHHVERARVARLEAARAARRAAWSALLQHGSLRRELLRSVARTLRRRNLTGAARRRAIARLIRRNLSAEQRAKLHAFIRTSSRANLQPATIASPVASAAAAATPAVAATLPAVTPIVSLSAPNGTSNGTLPTNGTSTVAPVPLVASTPSAAAPAAAEVSQKDKAAIEALVERIRAAVASSATTPDAASSVAPATVGVQVGAPVPAASMSRKASATRTMRFLQQKVSAAAAAEASAAASAARLARAEQLASEAEADALSTLSHSELDRQSGHVVLQSDAAAEAAARDADSWIKSHGF